MPTDNSIAIDPGILQVFLNRMPKQTGLAAINKALPAVRCSIDEYTIVDILENYVFDEGDRLVAAPGASPPEIDYTLTSQTGTILCYRALIQVTDKQQRRAIKEGAPQKYVSLASQFLKTKLMLRRATAGVTVLETTASWGAELTNVGAGTQWDAALGTPVTTISDEVANWADRRGGDPTESLILACPQQVLHKIRHNPETMGQWGGGKTGLTRPSGDELADMLDVRNVIRLGGSANANNPHTAAASMGTIWGKHAWLLELPPGADQSGIMPENGELASFGASFVVDAAGVDGMADEDHCIFKVLGMDSEYHTMHDAQAILGKTFYSAAILNNAAGHMFQAAIS